MSITGSRGKDGKAEMVKRLKQADREGSALSRRMLQRLRADERQDTPRPALKKAFFTVTGWMPLKKASFTVTGWMPSRRPSSPSPDGCPQEGLHRLITAPPRSRGATWRPRRTLRRSQRPASDLSGCLEASRRALSLFHLIQPLGAGRGQPVLSERRRGHAP